MPCRWTRCSASWSRNESYPTNTFLHGSSTQVHPRYTLEPTVTRWALRNTILTPEMTTVHRCQVLTAMATGVHTVKEGYGLLESGSPVNHCHEGLSCGFSAGNGAHARAAALGRELRARAARWNRRGSRLLVARQGCVLARAALVAMFDMALAARRLLHRHGE